MAGTVVAYVRESAGARGDAARQREAVLGWAAARGMAVARVYRDGPRRGAAGLAALLDDARRGGVGTVLVTRPCRLSPSLSALLRALGNLRDAGVAVVATEAGSPDGLAALMAALPCLTETRRGLRAEAVADGRERAVRRGVRLGRPPVPPERVARLREALAAGASLRAAARRAGVGVATASRLRIDMCGSPATKGQHT